MKKTLSLFEIIIHIILFIMLFIDGMYKYIAKSVIGSFENTSNCSFEYCAIYRDTSGLRYDTFPVGKIFIILLIISCIVLFLNIFNLKTFKIYSIIPIILLIAFVTISKYIAYRSGGSFVTDADIRRAHLEMGVLYYVQLALLLIEIALSIFKNFVSSNKTANSFLENLKFNSKKSTNTQPSNSTADELRKFKELLDSGTITQEEFDEKKKQLPGL